MRTAAQIASLAFAGALVVLVSCQAIVSDAVPAFTCTDNAGCPAGQYCKGAGCAACEATDVCDGLDNNCNGTIDEGNDVDQDTYSWCGTRGSDGRPQNADCDDNDPKVHPGAAEICNGIDDNCDGKIDEGVCTGGTTCIPTTGKCVVPCTLNSCNAGYLCDPETRECVSGTKVPPGSPCIAAAECVAGYDCIYESAVGASVLPEPGKGICSRTCCTSSDCPAGLVCYAPGTSGKYCVSPGKLGRPSPGSAGPGEGAANAESCRSGLIENGQCVDVCCLENDCRNGTHCSLGTISSHTTFGCFPSTGTKAQDGTCSGGNGDCRSGICQPQNPTWLYTARCIDTCCGSGSCKNLLQNTFGDYPTRCAYFHTSANSDLFPICAAAAPSGTTALGGTCGTNDDCRSGVCLGSICSDVCCTDKDCSAVPGMRCKAINNQLRCSK